MHDGITDEQLAKIVRSVKLLKEIQFAPVWWPRHLVLTTDRV